MARRGAFERRDFVGAEMMLDAIGLEVMAHSFAGMAEEMGALLVASSFSPNVRERRDDRSGGAHTGPSWSDA